MIELRVCRLPTLLRHSEFQQSNIFGLPIRTLKSCLLHSVWAGEQRLYQKLSTTLSGWRTPVDCKRLKSTETRSLSKWQKKLMFVALHSAIHIVELVTCWSTLEDIKLFTCYRHIQLQPRTKPVETHYKNTYFFALTLTKMLTVAN